MERREDEFGEEAYFAQDLQPLVNRKSLTKFGSGENIGTGRDDILDSPTMFSKPRGVTRQVSIL